MFCGYCGARLKEDSNFCGKCGTKVIKMSEELKWEEEDTVTFDKKEVIIHKEKESEDFCKYFYKPEDL